MTTLSHEQFTLTETHIASAIGWMASTVIREDLWHVSSVDTSEKAIVTAFDNLLHERLLKQTRNPAVLNYQIALLFDNVVTVSITNLKGRQCEIYRVSLLTLRQQLGVLQLMGECADVSEDDKPWWQPK